MDLKKLKSLIDLVAKSNIKELEVTEEKNYIRIIKESIQLHDKILMLKSKNLSDQKCNSITSEKKNISVLSSDKLTINDSKKYIIKSPMVGTFYHSSAPNSSPFVEIGSEVKIGTTLCIIEAMKLLNEINSEKQGIIKKILVENEQPVEFGQPLFILKLI
ncbi:acetyl-CoA carboxylase biotin carboxyl carrier protein subunit [Candidatus Profftella armatura (Diaphorina cf. continua)]|uniref:Biotin carboxyl carrier protein of acetyl-CoA carboxylase n=1 Tax=Candidatus Profftella armatura (Diaphorina cf. continua) TaxID=2661583 RepID=A0A7R6VYQ7_9PROT|nr:acetyl-CoA carboxylase biotin carboxyl carrier protein [Candidatus Profftella armatura (Diaphorina cf. continua)]BCG49484.1 acetyl-CoA carboxylase biotin carboxyl carrier protein subunit [Candidatus Profftella armatura (Diaphorina cf. continua)]